MQKTMSKNKRIPLKDVAPAGVLGGGFANLFDAGCMQTQADRFPGKKAHGLNVREYSESSTYFTLLHNATSGNPCIGCHQYQSGSCNAFKLYHSSQRGVGMELSVKERVQSKVGTNLYPDMTIAQIAKQLGISKSEVRRRKLKGEI